MIIFNVVKYLKLFSTKTQQLKCNYIKIEKYETDILCILSYNNDKL